MHRDEQVGLVPVGNVGTSMQGNEYIRLTGIDDLHVRTVELHQPAKGQGHIQVDGLLLRQRADGSCIVSTMSCINDQRELLRLGSRSVACRFPGSNGCHHHQHHQTYQKKYPILHCGCKITN